MQFSLIYIEQLDSKVPIHDYPTKLINTLKKYFLPQTNKYNWSKFLIRFKKRSSNHFERQQSESLIVEENNLAKHMKRMIDSFLY